MTYQAKYTPLFEKNLKRYRNLRVQMRREISRLLQDPYAGSERLGKSLRGKDLRGCRSTRVTHNFRVILVICEECRRVPQCQFCFCEGLPVKTVVFLTVGPHERAYTVHEEPAEYVTAT